MEMCKNISNLLIVLPIFLVISCQDEEFYEKNFLEKVGEVIPEEIENALPTEETNGTGETGGTCTVENASTAECIILDSQIDIFTQLENKKPIDILWVIDNSGSMRDEQNDLAYNFDAFINSFSEKQVDFKMAIITTDTRDGLSGEPVPGSTTQLTSTKMSEDKNKFLDDFSSLIKVGTNGWGREKGLKASYDFKQNHLNQNFREDAYLVTVYVSDEPDQSDGQVDFYSNALKNTKSNPGLFKAYSIVNKSINHERYAQIANDSNGKVSDIKSSFYETLTEIGSEISALASQFPLSKRPHTENSLNITVNGISSTDWDYKSDTNSILFLINPPSNAQIKIEYLTQR